MRKVYFLTLLFIFSIAALAQSGKITGKVINASSGQGLPSATVTLMEKSQLQVADLNGNFSFSKLSPGTYSINCSYTGYIEKIIEEIIVRNDDNTSITISLEEKKALDTLVLKSVPRVRAAGETIASLLIMRKNSPNVMDGITNEQIRKTPDRSTSDVIKRVSGASIQDDRFAIIRGLNDRYNAAFINGAPLPSTESDRKAFAFDIFPANIMDNLVIYKTATPDKTGEFVGGIIDITTKSIPEKNFISVSVGSGYNSLATGKNFYYSENKGSKDWIGIDDGTRQKPAGVPDSLPYFSPDKKAEIAKLYKNYKWGIQRRNGSPNFNFQIVKGITIPNKQKEFLGALFALTYTKSFSFSHGLRASELYDISQQGSTTIEPRSDFQDSVYNEEIVWSALANISLKLNNKNSISLKNNFSINTDNKFLKRFGSKDRTNDPGLLQVEQVTFYTSNQIYSSQLIGEHQVGPLKTKINWLAAYSKVIRDIPAITRITYSGSGNSFSPNFSSGTVSQNSGSGTMFSANSDEDIKSIKLDISQPYTFMKSTQNFIKIGGGYQKRKRNFISELYGLQPYSSGNVNFDYSLYELPADQLFLPSHLGLMGNGLGGFLLNQGTLPNSKYDATSETDHIYLMNDQHFFKKMRLIYGVRVERFNQKLYYQDATGSPAFLNTVVTDYLPSANFVYSLTPKMNIRLSYSVTLNRPEFRELAPYLFYDNFSQFTFEGYDSLRRAKIRNYDFRYEFYPGKAQLFSVSAFYKEFTDPIEIVLNPIYGRNNVALYQNAKSATVYGLELEFRTLISTLFGITKENAFLSKFTLAANGAYIKSNVKLRQFGALDPRLSVTSRALQGQSPYIINGSLAFNDEKTGLSSTLSLNRVADRVSIGGTVKDADLYEKARTVIDFQLAKSFPKYQMELKFTIRDILAQNIVFYNDFDKSKSFGGIDNKYTDIIAPRVFNLNATWKF